MIKKIFKNRIQQEDKDTLDKLKSTYINMNEDKETTQDTPDGLFLITIQPNSYVDEITLESDFRFILCLYYRWMYGSNWVKKQNLQFTWKGLIEKQYNNHNHIHFMIYEYNIEELAIFLGYIKAIFKQLHPKASFDFQRVYNINGSYQYIDHLPSIKDTSILKKRKSSCYLDSKMYQKPINNYGTIQCSQILQ